MFALSATVTATGVGAGVDLMRAYLAQQKLTHVASLTCQYAAARPVVATSAPAYGGTGSLLAYVLNVNNFLASTWATQQIPYPQLTANPFSGGINVAATVTVSANVPTTFMRIANITEMPVSATADCYPTGGPQPPPGGAPIVQEGFEKIPPPCAQGGVCYIAPNGHPSSNAKVPAAPSTYSPNNTGYVGTYGAKWYITGYCLETDGVGLISNTVPEGSTAAELDCDNGSGTAGNSAISTQTYMEVGNYELRWFYRSRIDYPHYDPAYICGSSAADTSWATDNYTPAFYRANSWRSNQINVYLDPPTSNGAPPFHYTLSAAYSVDGPVQLAGSNLIDECVYSPAWVERSVRVNVTTAGYYWLTFAADGDNDSFGGQIDNIRLCQGTCAGSPQDNFPSLSYNPNYSTGGPAMVNAAELPNWADLTLFQDTFQSPPYINNVTSGALTFSTNTNGNLNLSLGTSGPLSGWPGTTPSGWATAPFNDVYYNTALAAQGSQNVWLTSANGAGTLAARSMLLVPGFYNLSYSYVSNAIFPTIATASCGATPAAANLGSSGTLSGSGSGYLRTQTQFPVTGSHTANAIAAFLSNAQIVSEPITGGALGSSTSYTNPDSNLLDTPPVSTSSTTPTIKPDAISLTNYTASTTSALLDVCGYAPSWVARSVNFEISKTGMYWLNFSTQMASPVSYVLGSSSGTLVGGAIDNVRVTALGSPAMTSPPSNPVIVPVGGPQPASSVVFVNPVTAANAFTLVADPLTFPAPPQ